MCGVGGVSGVVVGVGVDVDGIYGGSDGSVDGVCGLADVVGVAVVVRVGVDMVGGVVDVVVIVEVVVWFVVFC